MASVVQKSQGRVSQGLALLLLEGTALAYAFYIVRGTWPPGHPWSALGALALAAILWSGATSTVGITVTTFGALIGLVSAWWQGLLTLH